MNLKFQEKFKTFEGSVPLNNTHQVFQIMEDLANFRKSAYAAT